MIATQLADLHEAYAKALRNGRTINLNQSRVQIDLDCSRKFMWQFYENLWTRRPGKNLEVGKSIHHGLALLGTGMPVDQAVDESIKELQKGFPTRRMPGDDELEEEMITTVSRMLPAYVEFWGGQSQLWKPLGIEVGGRVEVGDDTGVFLTFRTDKIVTWHKQLWLVDYKSMGKLDMRDLLKYEMDLQITAYIYGASRILKQLVHGVIVDALVKTKVPQFTREMYERSYDELIEFEHEFCQMARKIDFASFCAEQGVNQKTAFYKNTKECFRYGTCPYRVLCLKDNETRRLDFVNRTPDYVDDPRLLLPASGVSPSDEGPGRDDVQGSDTPA